ncbi:MAG: tetratricopeptide repeat protein [Armatimonadetes bacterium]|nr:tetratricopeptide repeat protein [Armatimonadota bacterium]
MRRFAPLIIALVAVLPLADAPPRDAVSVEQGPEAAAAIRRYESVLQVEPNNFGANLSLGILLLQSGKPGQAVPYLNRASAIEPGRPEPYMARANAYLDLRRPGTALQSLINGAKACAKLPEYWLMRAGVEAGLGRGDEARASAQQARKAAPKRADIAHQTGLFFVQLGDQAEAEKHFRAAATFEPDSAEYAAAFGSALLGLRHNDEALAVLQAAALMHPQDAPVALAHSRALERFRRTADALAALDRGVEAGAPAAPLLSRKAEILTVLGRADAALEALDHALIADSKYPSALLQRAVLRGRAGDPAGALADAEALLPIVPDLPQGHRVRYQSLKELGRIAEAEIALREWIAAVKTDPAPYHLLAGVLADRDAHAEAGAVLEALLKLRPGDATALDSLGRAYMSAGRAHRAAEIIQEAVDRGVKSPDLLIRLALAYRQSGETARALGALRQMRDEFPDDIRSWALEAATLERGRDFEAALATYRDLLGRHPNSTQALQGIARMLASLGRHEQSAEAWIRLADALSGAPPAYLAAANEFMFAGTAERADALWARLRRERPNDLGILAAQGQSLNRQDRSDEALQAYKSIIKLDPKNSAAYHSAANVLGEMDRWSDATDLLLNGLPSLLSNPAFLSDLSSAAAKAGRLDDYDAVLEGLIEERRFAPASVIAYVNSARRRDLLNEARRKLEAATQDTPDSGALWVGLARAQAFLGDARAALASIERAAELMPGDAQTVRTFTEAAEAARDSRRAAKAFGMLAKIFANDPAYVLKQAGYLIESGETQRARKVLQTALQKFPNSREVQNLLARLPG